MTAGTLNDDIESASLQHDMACILLEYTRDRPDGGVIGRRLAEREAKALAAELAHRLAPRIGGRYLPKRDEKSKRNRAAMEMFDGQNRDAVMKAFGISKRVFYRILADHLRSRMRE